MNDSLQIVARANDIPLGVISYMTTRGDKDRALFDPRQKFADFDDYRCEAR
jgi:hypothetical protein